VASRRIDTELDRLYQLPPDQFTAARNALAKEAGAEGAVVRALAKPPLAAWAVNQVHWKHRDVYDTLIASSNELRKIHKAVLTGRQGDIRDAGRQHDEAVEAALKAALAILRDAGHPATDATRQAIITTLRALPGDDPPGRLTRTLQPGGFEMLAGLSIAGARVPAPVERPRGEPPESRTVGRKVQPIGPSKRAASSTQARQSKAELRKAAQAEAAEARAAREAATKAVREAEQVMRRDQFEAARASREASKAEREVEEAREAVAAAQNALERAESEAAQTARLRDAAVGRASESKEALDAARAAARKL
jgi:flagellar biosynthesis GTPase FlhF